MVSSISQSHALVRLTANPLSHLYVLAYPNGEGKIIVSLGDEVVAELDQQLSVLQVRDLRSLMNTKGLDADLVVRLVNELMNKGMAALPAPHSETVTDRGYKLTLEFPQDLDEWWVGNVTAIVHDPDRKHLFSVKIGASRSTTCTNPILRRLSLFNLSHLNQWIKTEMARRGMYVFDRTMPSRQITVGSSFRAYDQPSMVGS